MMKCENCGKRIGFFKRWKQKYFRFKVFVRSPHGLFKYEKEVNFCSSKCVNQFEYVNRIKILN